MGPTGEGEREGSSPVRVSNLGWRFLAVAERRLAVSSRNADE
jgi:hypothetical protein